MSTWILTNYRWYMQNANFNWQIMLSSRPPKWQQTDNLKLYLTKSYLYLHLCTDIWQMMTKSISTFVLRIGRWLQICAWQITLWSYLKKSRLYLNLCTSIWQMISNCNWQNYVLISRFLLSISTLLLTDGFKFVLSPHKSCFDLKVLIHNWHVPASPVFVSTSILATEDDFKFSI